MKKNSPGCICCGDCERCAFKCQGDLCPTICGLRINITAPDNVPTLTGEDCPPVDDCIDEAPCNACYKVFDQILQASSVIGGGGWSFGQEFDETYGCDDATLGWNWLGYPYPLEPCWSASNYDCPDSNESSQLGCGPLTYIADAQVNVRNQWNQYTECGKITVTIAVSYLNTDCISPPPFFGTFFSFTYIFELDYCTCEEMMQAIPFVEVITETNASDPCNLESATLQLVSAEKKSAGCHSCGCWECSQNNIVNVAISGPGFTGTVPFEFGWSPFINLFSTSCNARAFFNINCPIERGVIGVLGITCKDCEAYDVYLRIERVGEIVEAKILNYVCGESRTFEITSYDSPECQLNEYTFSL